MSFTDKYNIKIRLVFIINNSKIILSELDSKDIINMAENVLTYQLLMIRRFPQVITSLYPSENYETEVKKYSRLLLDLSDNTLSISVSKSKNDVNSLIDEISFMSDFLIEVYKDKTLLLELNARDMIKYFHEKELINLF